MIALQAKKIEKAYIVDPVFSDVSFTINAGDKIGLVGPNGAGKTTLFACLTGELSLDSGELIKPGDLDIGYLRQHSDWTSEETLFTIVMSAFEDVLMRRSKLTELEKQISESPEEALQDLYETYQRELARYEDENGYSIESRAKGILRGLGFEEREFQKPFNAFSGGERTRAELAKLLVREPDILLLDEPTNHLDLNAVEWLGTYLANYDGTLLLISHDRYFLDETVNRIFELDHRTLKAYTGNYTKHLALKQAAEEAQHKAYLKQQTHIAKEKAFIERNRAGVMAKQARGRETKLARLQPLEDRIHRENIRLLNMKIDDSANQVLTVEGLSKSYDHPLFENLSFNINKGEKVGLIGPNGAGKSTILKLLLGDVPSDGGQITFGSRVEVGYYDQNQSELDPEATVLEQIIYASDLTIFEARSVLAAMLFFEEDLEQKTKSLSGGEKARLSLLLLLLKQPNFIILDEPTNHLDIASRGIVEDFLINYPGSLLIVSHDRYLLDRVTSRTLALEKGQLISYLGNYSYYRQKKTELARIEAEKQTAEKVAIVETRQTNQKRSLSRSKLRQQLEALERRIEEEESALSTLNGALEEAAQKTSEHIYETYEHLAQAIREKEAALDALYNEWADVNESLEAVSS